MNPTFIPVLTFAAGTCAAAGLYSLVADLYLRDRSRISTRLQDEFRIRSKDGGRKSPLFKDLKLLMSEDSQERLGLWHRFQTMVDQSGFAATAERILTISCLTGVGVGALAAVLTLNGAIGLLGCLVGAGAPVGCVYAKRKARIQKLCNQLPEAFEMMSRAIRAGQTISGAFQAVADNFEDPIAEEFAICHEQQSLGLSQEIAMRELARRAGVMELQMFVVAILVQRQSGGNPVEVLENLSSVIRKRVRLLGKVKALTGEGRMQALVLLLLPPVVFLALYILNPSYAQILLERPKILAGIVLSEAFGAAWIRRITNFDF